MAYGLIRVRNLHAKDIRSTEVHNDRLYDELGLERPANIKETNPYYGHNRRLKFHGELGLEQSIQKRLGELKITPRKDSVIAIEYVMGFVGTEKERKTFDECYSISGFLDNCLQYIIEKHGFDNMLTYNAHYDENTPHVHIVVLPIVEKTVKWKNQRGEGERKEHRLCARDFTGDREKLRNMQQNYYEWIKTYEPRFKIKFYRGTLVEEQTKKYVKQTSHEIGELRKLLEKTKDLAEIKEIQTKLEQKQKEFDNQIEKNSKQIERDQDKKQNNGWMQGKNFNRGF